jgi:hypothetical protein
MSAKKPPIQKCPFCQKRCRVARLSCGRQAYIACSDPRCGYMGPNRESITRTITAHNEVADKAEIVRLMRDQGCHITRKGDYCNPLPIVDCQCGACDYLRRKQAERS